MARWHTCNILQPGTGARTLWRFSPNGDGVRLEAQSRHLTGQPLPASQIRKDWRSLWQKKLNIAWLPEEHVFVRVLQLPAADPAEVLPMVELQLEKLSPIPVAQVVWSAEILPGATAGERTVVVLIAERRAVEEFLGRLEGDGFVADRLDLPLLHQVLATSAREDGVWIHLERSETGTTALVAWRLGGMLAHLNLIRLPHNDEAARLLTEQLSQHAWAGETEGWYVPGVRWHLVVESGLATLWEPALRNWAGGTLEVEPAPAPEKVAALTARRATDTKGSLLPPEHALRYRQMFFDGLWMRGLFAVAGLYVVGVVVYLAALQVMVFKGDRLTREITNLHGAYMDTLQLKDRIRVLQEQVDLRFAALNCWRTVCEVLPAELTLTELTFSRGQTLGMVGTVSGEEQSAVTKFNSTLRKAEIEGLPLFDKSRFEAPTFSPQPGGGYRWTFKCELQQGEVE